MMFTDNIVLVRLKSLKEVNGRLEELIKFLKVKNQRLKQIKVKQNIYYIV